MRIDNRGFLKFIYNILLIGVPQYTTNPLNQNRILAELTVKPQSTYLNYKLNEGQIDLLNSYVKNYSNDLTLVPLKLSKYSYPEYYLSVNIYNCTSPIMMSNKNLVRCELNTYIKTSEGEYGTLILDYVSNELSLDPINIFKPRISGVKFEHFDSKNSIKVESKDDNIQLDLSYKLTSDSFYISKDLVRFTDYAFYKNGVADKVYYDSLLGNAVTKYGEVELPCFFKYKGMEFNYPDSIFYFDNSINFVGSVWHNLN